MPRAKGLCYKRNRQNEREAARRAAANTPAEESVDVTAECSAGPSDEPTTGAEPVAAGPSDEPTTVAEPVAGTGATSLPPGDLPPPSNIPLDPTVQPTRRRRFISPPARASARISARQQSESVIVPVPPVPNIVEPDPISVAIDHEDS